MRTVSLWVVALSVSTLGAACSGTGSEDATTISMDDFVLDWRNSFAFQNAEIPTGYVHHTAMDSRADFAFVGTPSDRPGDVLMIDNFVTFAKSRDKDRAAEFATASRKTQEYLDAVWSAIVNIG